MSEPSSAPAPDAAAAAASADGAPEKKKRGKPKDPDAPPKPKNAYQRVSAEARVRIKEQRPEVATDLKAMAAALKEEWDKVPQEEKDKMQAEYEKEMEIWKPKWEAYKLTPGYKEFFELKQDWIDGKMRKKLIKKHRKDAPKRPKSGYMIHAGEVREKVAKEVMDAGGGMADIGKKIAEYWNALSEAKKAEYGEQSARQKEVFDVEFAKYKLTDKFKEFCDEKAKLESKQVQKKLIRTKLRDAPKKAPSAFGLFRSEVMGQVAKESKGLSTGELAKKVAGMWKEVPEDKRAAYQKTADEAKVIYDKQLAEFRKNKVYATYLKERMKVKLRENRLLNLRDAPKKPKTVFALYAERHKKEVPPGKGAGKGSSALKAKFSQAEEDEKKALEEKSKELKEKYMEEVKVFKESDRFKAYEKNNKSIQKELSTAALKIMTIKFLNAAPAAPPRTPFAVFVAEKRKASGAAEQEKKSKQVKKEEVLAFNKEWMSLDKPSKSAYETTYKEKLKEWEGDVKTFMAQDIWKEYLAEAKEFKVPVKNLLAQKSAALKQLSGGAGLPDRPETMPTRPPDAYKVFCQEKGGEAGGDGAKLLKMWEELSVEGKSKYFTEAGKLQEEYDKEMTEFKKTEEGKTYFRDVGRILRVRKIKKARTLYLKDMPKPPPSALKTFLLKTVAELKKSSPQLKGFEAKKQAEDRWKAMSPDERRDLEEEARAKFQAYQEKMGDFKKTTEFTKFTRARLTSAPPQKPSGAPQKPLNAFRAYIKEMKGLGKTKQQLEEDFKALPEEDLNERKRKAKELEDKYSEEVKAFQKTPEWKTYKKQQALHQKRTNITLAKSKFCTNAPKKPPSAVALFANDKRREIMTANPELKGLAVLSEAGKIWKTMSQEEKGPWLEREKESMTKYNEAKAEFESSEEFKAYAKVVNRYNRKPRGKAKAKGASKKSSGPKPPPAPENLPKRPPVAAVGLWMKDNPGNNLKTANEKWVQLGAEGQKPYVDKLKELQAEYAKEFKEFQKSAEGKKYLRLKNAFDKKQKMEQVKQKHLGGEDAPKEPKRPQSAYFLFVGEKRESVTKELGTNKIGDVAKRLTELWGQLAPEDKKVYEDKNAEAKKEYEKAMEEFKSSAGYKAFNRAMQSIKKSKGSKPKPKPKAKGGGRGSGGGRGRGRGGQTSAAASAADSDSDAMGSDSSSSSSSDEDSD